MAIHRLTPQTAPSQHRLSEPIDAYVRLMAEALNDEGVVRTRQLGKLWGCIQRETVEVLKVLLSEGLINYDPIDRISLTPKAYELVRMRHAS